MTGMLLESDPEVVEQRPRVATPQRWQLPTHWPLSLVVLGFPIWWALGLSTILPMAISIVMADQLLRRRRIALPRGFAFWALFLAWMALGIFVLFADAPDAVPGGDSSRILIFVYRAAWYLTATVVLLWVANLRESELPTRWVYQLLAFMFVVTTVGGLIGVVAPTIEFTSVVEMLLPRGLRANGLVQAIAHPAVADIENILGRPQARPKAPFAYANSWGSNLVLFLPFFLVAWFRQGPRWQRFVGPVVLVMAAVPVVYSLNRGLWVAMALGAAGFLWLQVSKGRALATFLSAALLVMIAVIFLLSPLSSIVQDRVEHQHSNERRSQLLEQTVSSTLRGSPVVGFGSTRDVQGSFSSIAGASTPDCPKCGVPPLGTQGHIWQVIFAQGFVGLGLFLTFFVMALAQCWRCRTTVETLCTFSVAFFLLLLPVYDTLGIPLVTVMVAIGLLAREQRTTARAGSTSYLEPALGRLRATWPLLLVTTLLGATLGGAVAALEPVQHSTRLSILLTTPPAYLSTDDRGSGSDSEGGAATSGRPGAPPISEVTIDTEAALLVSRQSLSRVARSTDPDVLDELRARIRVTAVPNTQVLVLEVQAPSGSTSREEAERVAESYLMTRRAYLSNRRDQALLMLRAQLAELAGPDGELAPAGATAERLERAVASFQLTPTSAGEVIRVREPARVRRQLEVPVTAGAGLGLLAGALVLAMFPGWRPRWRRRR
jgi:hypothetical protein